jgi:hypothetical protein
MLRPTARIHVVATTGSITGVVSPANPASNVAAVTDSATVASTVTGDSGAFTLALLPAGLYDVRIDAPDGYRDTTIAGVSVTAGQTRDLGVVTLSPQ